MISVNRITCSQCGKCVATIIQNGGELKIYPFVLPKDAYDKYEPDVHQVTFPSIKETVTYPVYCTKCGNKGLD